MSSKSKKQQQKTARQRHEQAVARKGAAAAAPEPEHHGLEIPDEVLHAPAETSKLRFALMIGLVIVLLIIFIVPTALLNIASGDGPSDGQEFTWQRPGHGLQQLSSSDYITQKRGFEAALAVDPLLGYQFGLPQGTLEREQVVRLIVLDQLAQDAGIRIDQADLAEHLRLLLNFPPYNRSAEVYKQVASQYGGVEYIESNIKRCLAGQRYLTLAGFAGAVADPAAIEKAWNEDHVEVSFDYVELNVADLDEAARSELPDDAALEAWFEQQPEDVRGKLKLPERRAVQFARYADPESTPAVELLAAFPPPEDIDAEESANEYYNRVFHLRFVKPPVEDGDEEADTGEAGADEADAGQPELQEFVPFEEAREQCLVEAPVYYAMQAWLTDLQARQNAGEEVDLATEAASYGLQLTALDEPITREELEANEELGDASLVNEVFFTPPDAFGYRVLTTENGLFVLRVTERVEPSLPEFAAIKTDVADQWVEPRRAELATEKLQALWESFEEYEPEKDEDEGPFAPPDDGRTHRRAGAEAFRTAVEAAGFTVATRDFQDKADAEFGDDWYGFYDLDVDEVAEPAEASDGEAVRLVRVSAQRAVPIERMSPREYDQYKRRARAQVSSSVATGFDLAYLEKAYELWLRPIEELADDEFDDEFDDEPSE